MHNTTCLNTEALAALLESEASEALAEHGEHLETCGHCQQTVAELSEKRWSLQEITRCLRLAAADGDSPTEPALTRAMAQLKNELTLLSEAADEGDQEPDDALAILTPSERPDLLGTLGGYEVEEVLGRGGMGVVFKALDPVLNRRVAIKVMGAAAVGGPAGRRRFIREAQAAAAVCHDHLVPLFGVHEAAGLPYLVMQLVVGESLEDRLCRIGRLDVTQAVDIARQTAAGLAAAHAQGLIHRDIKPANLLLEAGQDRVKITDFGLARTANDAGLTQPGMVAGTPEYMAPEQARGEPLDHRADLCSLGCVLYAMCAGRPPFCAATPLAVLRRICDEAPAPIRTVNPQVPAWLESFIERLLAKDPAERLDSAAEVASLLEGYLAHLRQPLTTPAPELPVCGEAAEELRPIERGARRPALWIFGLVALLGAGLAIVGLHPWGRLFPAGDVVKEPNAPKGVVRWDFRGQAPDEQLLAFVGQDAHGYCKVEAEGLRISLPAKRAQPWPIGVRASFPVKGDCEITASYELLLADRPSKGYGVGATLYIVTETPAKKAAMVGRMNRPQGSTYICDFNWTDQTGKRHYEREDAPSEIRSGKLRLVRRGPWVSYHVAEGADNEFRELRRVEFGTDDLTEVRVAGDTGTGDRPVEVRFRDFEIRAGDLPTPEPRANQQPSRWWLRAFLFILLLLVLLVIGGLAMSRRRRLPRQARSAMTSKQTVSEQAGASQQFACTACSKRLKVRPGLAGKKVKCPHCEQVVAVPMGGTNVAIRPVS
jgi:hypothetical protein